MLRRIRTWLIRVVPLVLIRIARHAAVPLTARSVVRTLTESRALPKTGCLPVLPETRSRSRTLPKTGAVSRTLSKTGAVSRTLSKRRSAESARTGLPVLSCNTWLLAILRVCPDLRATGRDVFPRIVIKFPERIVALIVHSLYAVAARLARHPGYTAAPDRAQLCGSKSARLPNLRRPGRTAEHAGFQAISRARIAVTRSQLLCVRIRVRRIG